MLPPVTNWPPKRFTPSRWPWESRPFTDEPPPFLCAIEFIRNARFAASGAKDKLVFLGLQRQNIAKRDVGTKLAFQILDQYCFARRDTILLAPRADDRVHIPSRV